MTWTIKTPPEHQHNRINKFFEENIIGFKARGAAVEENRTRAEARDYLPKDNSGVFYPTIWLAAYQGKQLVGAINTAISYPMVLDVVRGKGDNYARGFARERRVLAALAVREDMRRQGIALALLEANEVVAKSQDVSVIAGFFDEKNGSPAVYTAAGYTLMPRNTPVPRLGQFSIPERHEPPMKGQWFYKSI